MLVDNDEHLNGDDWAERSSSAKKRFLASMVMDYEKWHDGTGYDLAALDEMTQEDLQEIEGILRTKLDEPWRTFEALDRINTPASLSEIERALKHTNLEVRIAAARFSRERESERERVLVEALANAEFYGGLTQALDQVETFHPPAIVDALIRGLLMRGDSGAVSFAGMLLYIFGKADSSFDWEQRPLFLRFGAQNIEDRRKAFVELCEIIGVDASRYLTERSDPC